MTRPIRRLDDDTQGVVGVHLYHLRPAEPRPRLAYFRFAPNSSDTSLPTTGGGTTDDDKY